MSHVEVPWTYSFTLEREDDRAQVDAFGEVLRLVYNIARQTAAYFGAFKGARLQCRGSDADLKKTAVAGGVRYDFYGVAVVKPLRPSNDRMMQMNEQQIEHEIQAKGLNAPRLTPELIEAAIVSEHYVTGPEIGHTMIGNEHLAHSMRALGCLTVCVLVLRNGFTVVGKSACASPENFDAELGAKIAREDAKRQIWALEGYALKSKLAERDEAQP